MSVPVQKDPDEGWQKRKKTVAKRSFSKLRAFVKKALVHRKTLIYFINVALAIYKLIKFIHSFF